MKDLILVGASGLAREVAAADQHDYTVVGILDDDPGLHGQNLDGIPIWGAVDLAADSDTDVLVCIGSGSGRRRLVDRLRARGVGDDRYATLVDASVRLPRSSVIGVGSVLLAQTVLTADVSIGRHVVLMPHATLTHDDLVEDFATLAAGVCLGGGVRIGEEATLGMNASVRQLVRVGRESVLGMGSVLLTDLPAGQTWVGVPARRQRERISL